MAIQNYKDFYSGLLFAATGAFFIIVAQENELGSAARMGPAYFPTLLGLLLTFLGLLVAAKGYRYASQDSNGRVDPFNWRILTFVLGSVLVFSLLLNFAGLLIALAALICIASLADSRCRVREMLALIAVLDLIAYVVFVYLIGMNVAVWPTFHF